MRIQDPRGGISNYGTMTLLESATDAAISGADAFSGPAYQDGVGHGVEVGGAIVHGLIGLGAGVKWLEDTGDQANQDAFKVGTEAIKMAGYCVGAGGAPVVGGLLVGVGTLGDLLTLFQR